MPKASELKRGEVVEIDGQPHIVKHLESKSPSSRGSSTLYKIRFNNLITGQKKDVSVKGDESYDGADFSRAPVLFSYIDDQQYIFMNTEDYSQYALGVDALEDQIVYLTDGLEGITALLVEGNIVAIDLPQSIIMAIEDTAPGIKGASANARTKPAVMPTGLTVQVPEYIERGELIKINTADGKYMTRA